MTNPLLQIGRNLSEHRIAAYECTVDASAVTKGKRVAGWYGMFHEEQLKQEFMPKLAEYADQGRSYPFLITSYKLEGKTDTWIETPGKRGRARDVKFRPRRQRTAHQSEAVVYSRTRYQLLR